MEKTRPDYKAAMERLGKFGKLFLDYKGCPRGATGRLCAPLEDEVLSMDVLTEFTEYIPHVTERQGDEFTSGFRVISAMLAVSSGVKMVAVRGLLALKTETSPTRSLSSLSILSPAVQIVTTPVARASHFCLPLTVAREFRLCLHPHGMLRVQSLHLPHTGLGSALPERIY